MFCRELHELFNSIPRIEYPFNITVLPLNGIYVMFEFGEKYMSIDRIVRIGTHRGQNNIRNRLIEHYVNENADRSIFRKNIGRAILNKRNDAFLNIWELDFTETAVNIQYGHVRNLEYEVQVEREVTNYIRSNISFVVFRVDNQVERLRLESGIIASIAQENSSPPLPNPDWLGLYSPINDIRNSGLWLKQHLHGQQLTVNEFNRIKQLVSLRV